MLKNLRKIGLAILLFSHLGIKAQTDSFGYSEKGKIIFYEVIPVDTLSGDTLFERADRWMTQQLDPKTDEFLTEDRAKGELKCSTSFMVYVPSMISSFPHGRIFYTISVEIKDKKYRYTFTDFIFQYYQQARDLSYKPVPKRFKALEELKFSGYTKAWANHKRDTRLRVDAQIRSLKLAMLTKPKPPIDLSKQPDAKPVIKSKDW